ncbi:23S rRNA (adenine(2030)-N(6))-methyltransferase [Aurantivibrio infirmus]
MLSYRHSYHAGNFADVVKHSVLIEILKHLIKKEAGFDYIDTHAGAGLYDLESEHAQKLQEHESGFTKIEPSRFPELDKYFDIVCDVNKSSSKKRYPGSPVIAMNFLRSQDRSWLFELHSSDFVLLKNNTLKNKRVRLSQSDGFKGALALLPPLSRRGLVLIDPSYEIKSDYQVAIEFLASAYKKFSTGIYALWYPVVDRTRIDSLERKIKSSGIKNIQRFELGITEDRESGGMTAAGVIVINPPWTLMKTMQSILPKFAEDLGQEKTGYYKSDVLVGE